MYNKEVNLLIFQLSINLNTKQTATFNACNNFLVYSIVMTWHGDVFGH